MFVVRAYVVGWMIITGMVSLRVFLMESYRVG